ncbi:MAG: ABC transporter substrate-binding protein [Acidimicrobiales bacterium]|jgi:iron complex transport system substrate-binding protein|nr:ABC transporter substrate-binding protein [Acidimicrobiales bacterium]
MIHRLTGSLAAALMTVGLAACGGAYSSVAMSGSPGVDQSPAAYDAPGRIVSISTVATEMLFAIGAGERVVAVDAQSNYPAEVPITDLNSFEPNVEAILGFQPDLVVLSYDPGDVVANLEAAGVSTLLQGAANTIADTYSQIEVLGAVTGHENAATTLVADMRAEIIRLSDSVEFRDDPLSYYHELDDTLYTVTSSTFIGEVYALAGLVNAADPADADSSAWGYPQVSAEYILDADPDLIFLADTRCCAQDAVTIAARPGWENLTAVNTGRIVELDDDVASRWGPRIVDFLQIIVDAVNSVD